MRITQGLLLLEIGYISLFVIFAIL